MKNCSEELSVLGFGCMRLPVTTEGKVDHPEAVRMIRHGIDHGINYLDTAYFYHNGESETVLGEALLDGYREKVKIATKLPSWFIQTREDFDKFLDEQMKKLQTDHIDFYPAHGMGKDRWEQLSKLGAADFFDDAIADGRIGYVGFSYHDIPDNFVSVADGYDWTFTQIQYNFMDEDYQAGTRGLKYAAEKGLGIVVMEPLKGGMLTKHVPEVDKIWAESGSFRSPAGWGLQWVWDHPEVDVVLSGMTTMDQVKENLKYAETGRPGQLTAKDLALFEKVKEAYRSRIKVDCTRCDYCQPCPGGVNVSGCFNIYNNAFMYGDPGQLKMVYNMYMADGCASKCTECGECEEKCPQKLPIRDTLKDVVKLFGK